MASFYISLITVNIFLNAEKIGKVNPSVVDLIKSPVITFELNGKSISNSKVIHEVDEGYLSITLDSCEMYLDYIKINLSDATLQAIARNLSPAFLRIGGTAADAIYFNETCYPNSSMNITNSDVEFTEDNKRDLKCVSGETIQALGKFAQASNLNMTFDFNVLLRNNETKEWDPTNCIKLLKYLDANNIFLSGVELGNEPNLLPEFFNQTITPAKLVKDYKKLLKVLRSLGKDKLLVLGPAATQPRSSLKYIPQFLKHSNGKCVDRITFHHYYFPGKTAVLADYLNVTIMDSLKTDLLKAIKPAKRFCMDTPVWLGETSSGYGGGTKNISNTFAGTFLSLDKLGLAAKYGIDVVMREAFVGSWNGLITPKGKITPDYFVMLLHKHLLGSKVLDTKYFLRNQNSLPGFRIYAHCSKVVSGGVTIFIVNVENVDVLVHVKGSTGKAIREYQLLPAGGLTSELMLLNGKLLKLKFGSRIPKFIPTYKQSQFHVKSLSIGFWEFPFAFNPKCKKILLK